MAVYKDGEMLRIDLRSLEPGHHEMTLESAPEEVGLDGDVFSNILVEVRLDYDGKKAFVRIRTSAMATLVCDRTLVNFDQSITSEHSVLFTPEEGSDENLEMRPISGTDEELDITDIVRDTILLSVPVRKIAPGAEEEEIPVAFGEPAEADIDPRWEALRALKNEDGGD